MSMKIVHNVQVFISEVVSSVASFTGLKRRRRRKGLVSAVLACTSLEFYRFHTLLIYFHTLVMPY